MGSDRSSFASRAAAAVVALFTAATLVLRVAVRASEEGGLGEALLHLSQFFTILTSTLVLALMLAVASGASVAPRLAQALVVSIVGAGIVYHVALAHLLDLSGPARLADIGVHTIVPALAVAWWLIFAPKVRSNPSAVLAWIAWPLAYFIYILGRAAWSGFYPYPFIDLPEIGPAGLIKNILILGLVFIAIGMALSVVSSIFARLSGTERMSS